MFKNKIIKLLSVSSFLSLFSIISCSNQTDKINQNSEIIYKQNDAFLNKTNLETKEKTINFSLHKNVDNIIPILNVIKIYKGDKIKLDDLPKQIKVLDELNEIKWINVFWDFREDKIFYSDDVITGQIRHNKKNIITKLYVLTQSRKDILESDFLTKEERMTIDFDKSTHDGGRDALSKLIDRSGDYVNTNSRWDNWNYYDRAQNTNFVFHWEEKTNISRIEINFWRWASRGESTGRLPKNIYIQHSEDGMNWTNVENQDKISAQDLGPMLSHPQARLANTSDTKKITFDTVKTNWIRIHWEPATDSSNRNLIIGITNIAFKGLDKEDNLIFSSDKSIKKFKYGNTIIENFSSEINIESNNLDDELEVYSNATLVQKEIIYSDLNRKKYKVLSYDDKGEYLIYDVNIKRIGD
ncbi:hypothetical protein [Mesomycoplasma molare]|uniref:F5/8 type C domain-containing protein n=1 Tax=Mesomycoplasma molare TaxID=171288 RepID=A0ABY5TV78_9BACT|nr:hypothetical protein [Mesomycoplasma molare]UWD34455.1 hypothetical protein NX772_01330 [Mesomycoplasma molare]